MEKSERVMEGRSTDMEKNEGVKERMREGGR